MHCYNSHAEIKDPDARIKAIEQDIAKYKKSRTERQVQELMNIHDSGGDGISHAQRTGMENTIEDRTLQRMLDDDIQRMQNSSSLSPSAAILSDHSSRGDAP